MKYKLSAGFINDTSYERFEFENHEDLEEYFLLNLWGSRSRRQRND